MRCASGTSGRSPAMRRRCTNRVRPASIPCAARSTTPRPRTGRASPRSIRPTSKTAGELVVERQKRRYGCWRCPIACGGIMKAGTGEYAYPEGAHKPEYETMAMFGSNLCNDNLDSLIVATDICNRLGIDTISAGACVAFAIECYENGVINAEDTGGLEMNWGDHRAIVAMTEMIGRREGFGDVLADGVRSPPRDRPWRRTVRHAHRRAGGSPGTTHGGLGVRHRIRRRSDPRPAQPGRRTASARPRRGDRAEPEALAEGPITRPAPTSCTL